MKKSEIPAVDEIIKIHKGFWHAKVSPNLGQKREIKGSNLGNVKEARGGKTK